MLDMLQSIVDTLTAIIDFIVQLVQDLIFVVETLGQAILTIPDYLSWLPAEVASLFIIAFSVVLIYKIVGREG